MPVVDHQVYFLFEYVCVTDCCVYIYIFNRLCLLLRSVDCSVYILFE